MTVSRATARLVATACLPFAANATAADSPGVRHALVFRREDQADVMTRVVGWFNRYLRPVG